MFNFMLKHKKGFTLVELMIVMVLMGFGVVALANLFQSAYRTFNQTEERYIKQEMVKTVAEYLQSSISIGAATKAEIYPDSSVVPTSGVSNNPYHYVYIEKYDMEKGSTYTDKEWNVSLDKVEHLFYRDYQLTDKNEQIYNEFYVKGNSSLLILYHYFK